MGVMILAGGTGRRMGPTKHASNSMAGALIDIVFDAAREYDRNVVIVGRIADRPEVVLICIQARALWAD